MQQRRNDPLPAGPSGNAGNPGITRLFNGEIPDLEVSNTAGRFCSDLGADRADDSAKHGAILEFWVGQHFPDMRNRVLDAADYMLHNTDPNIYSMATILVDMVSSKELKVVQQQTLDEL